MSASATKQEEKEIQQKLVTEAQAQIAKEITQLAAATATAANVKKYNNRREREKEKERERERERESLWQ